MQKELKFAANKFYLVRKRFKSVAGVRTTKLPINDILAGVMEALQEVELHIQGKLKLKTLQEVLDEL